MGGGWRELRARVRPAARWYLLGSALIGAAHTVTWTLLGLYLDASGMTKSQIGLVQSFDSWGKVAVAIPAAVYLARRPARPAFVVSALVGGAAYTLLPWLSDLRAICAVNLVAGFAMTLHYVAIAPFLFRHTGPGERAMVFGLAEAVRTSAAVVGALSAGLFVEQSKEWLGGEAAATGWAICAAGVVSMLAAGVYARIQDGAPSLARGEPLLPVLRRHRGLLARFALPQFVMACGAGFCIPFLPLYFRDRFALSNSGFEILFASGQVLMTLGFLATPLILKRLGFVRSIITIELCSIPFFLLLAFTMDVRLAMAAFLMRGALMNATHPIHKNLMMQATPPGAREMQTGINATLWGVGWVIGPLAAGRVLDATGNDYSVLMLSTVGLYLTAAVLTWILLSPVERRSREHIHTGGSLRPRPASEEGA